MNRILNGQFNFPLSKHLSHWLILIKKVDYLLLVIISKRCVSVLRESRGSRHYASCLLASLNKQMYDSLYQFLCKYMFSSAVDKDLEGSCENAI